VKVLISVDMEGVTGVTHPDGTLPHGADYGMYRRFMTRDADAAVKGAFDAGATEVIVIAQRCERRRRGSRSSEART
jgi:D-amino peptidase